MLCGVSRYPYRLSKLALEVRIDYELDLSRDALELLQRSLWEVDESLKGRHWNVSRLTARGLGKRFLRLCAGELKERHLVGYSKGKEERVHFYATQPLRVAMHLGRHKPPAHIMRSRCNGDFQELSNFGASP